MKLFLISLLLLSSTALAVSANTIAFTLNQGGGEIVLTDMTSPGCPVGQHWAYTRIPSGETSTGCWYFVNPFVFVRWVDGTYRTYPIQSFTLVPRGH